MTQICVDQNEILQRLNNTHGIPGFLKFSIGRGGLHRAELQHGSGSSAEVYLHGGHVASWKDASGEDRLFMSSKAEFKKTRPIRGGIPLVFPQFGASGPLVQHGFARTSLWEVNGAAVQPDGTVCLKLRLQDSADTRQIWPHRFLLGFEISLGQDLETVFRVTNMGQQSFSFQNALHTYFSVKDVRKVSVEGLAGLEYGDSVGEPADKRETSEKIMFSGEVNRVYRGTPYLVKIVDPEAKRVYEVWKSGMLDSVVWNPWIERSKSFKDLGEADYLRMVCVESGNIAHRVEVAPAVSVECWQKLRVV